MPIDTTRARKSLKDFDLKTLFIEELGWDHHTATLEVPLDGHTLELNGIAQKRGMVAFVLEEPVPDYPTRRKIERQVVKSVHEHLIIFTDPHKTTQIWQWVKREAGKPTACREHTYHRNQPGDALIQKLQNLIFSLDEEENLTIVDVAGRARVAFDVERVTKRFYDRFKTEHAAFLNFLKGIPDEEMQRWYISVMINRLMFIYFIQKKGFLDNDTNYLRSKLAQSKQHSRDRFYKDFLCPLFFEGFAKKESERPAASNQLLGKVPYLNGGLFLRHQIEEMHGEHIQIVDSAFEKLFEFFDSYQWHLDERPLRADDEINPDVLGYIFEKYINQKQMGAYYTKEDITGYISKNTVIPFLFDVARQKCKIAFEGEHPVWQLLQANPDRYIYSAVRKGVNLPLPLEIAAGLNDVSKRTEWNKSAPEEYALPTEIWREVVARRKRYEEVCGKMVNGEIQSINDLITYNLDIRQFAQDVIENCEGSELLRAFWHAIEQVTVLDPTCGSGAFLFAALNILEPLYEACLERMEAFLSDLERSGEKHRPEKFGDFRKVLERVAQHPNRRHFILKSTIVNNLFGVDIMEEATEICKLRLFLKLVAQVERGEDIEPLPDIDFNIRAGNTLVGFATYDEVKRAIISESTGQLKMRFDDTMQRIDEKAQDVDRLFGLFREMQTKHGMEAKDFADAKRELRKRLSSLEDELNRYLAGEYDVDVNNKAAYERWLASHKPFHWFIEFYGIVKQGGFDVIIGNPPYVEYKDVKTAYTVRGFETLLCGDLYAYVVERSCKLIGVDGHVSVIVPISIFGTDGFKSLQDLSIRTLDALWVSYFANRPSQLFDGAQKRLTILLGRKGITKRPKIHTTTYLRWVKEERNELFATRIQYSAPQSSFQVFPASLEKLGSTLEVSAFSRFLSARDKLGAGAVNSANHCVYYTRKFGYFLAFLDSVPRIVDLKTGRTKLPSELKDLGFSSLVSVLIAIATLSSSAFFWFWNVLSDCRNLNRRDLLAFPLNPERISGELKGKLSNLGGQYL